MGGEAVAYHLRPNKAIDRGLFIDLLSRVGRCYNISDYTYYGFGGPFMEDFRALHAALRIRSMCSIERDAVVQARQRFNCPLSDVKFELADSSEFLTTFSPSDPSIVWLDFTDPGELKQQLDDSRNLISKLSAGDIFKITLNARVASLLEKQNLNEEQLKLLRKQVFEGRAAEYLPDGFSADDFRPDRYADLLLKSLLVAVHRGIFASTGLFVQPLTAFTYGDGEQMLTAVGIVLKESEKESFLQKSRLEHWEFSELGWERAQKISVPVLSTKERLVLESLLPKADHAEFENALGKAIGRNGIELSSIKSFARYYRIYPHYGRISF